MPAAISIHACMHLDRFMPCLNTTAARAQAGFQRIVHTHTDLGFCCFSTVTGTPKGAATEAGRQHDGGFA